jgi:hypothetical protein
MSGNKDMFIVKLLADPKENRIVSVVQQVLQRLSDQKIAYRMKIPPKLVGVHPANRDGQGCTDAAVHRSTERKLAFQFILIYATT